MKFFLFPLISVVFFMCSCANNEPTILPVILSEWNYEINFNNSYLSKIVKKDNNYLINQEVIGKLNDTTMLSILYNSYYVPTQKKYYFTMSNGLTYKSVDSISESDLKVISAYIYEYDTAGFLIEKKIDAKKYSDNLFETVATNITGNVLNEISESNVVQTLIERTYEGVENYTEKEIFEYAFTDHKNVDGIQNFSQNFTGNPNKNLIDSVRYSHYINNELIEKGSLVYSYDINPVSKRIQTETKLYTSDDKTKNRVKTINYFTYPTE